MNVLKSHQMVNKTPKDNPYCPNVAMILLLINAAIMTIVISNDISEP